MEAVELQSWLQFHTLVCAGLAVILFLIYSRLYQRPFLRYWALGWAAMTLHEASAWATAVFREPRWFTALAGITGWIGALLEAALMVLAGLALHRRSVSLPLRVAVFGLGGAAVVAGLFGNVRVNVWAEALSAGALVYFAAMFALHHPRGSTVAGLVTSGFCILHAAHRVTFALGTVGLPLFPAPVAFIDTTLVFGLSIGLIVSVVEHAHSMTTQLESLWDSSVAGMVLADRKGVVLRANSAFADLVGKPLESIVGQPAASCFSDSPDSGPRRRVKLWNDRELWLDISSSQVDTPSGRATFSILRDVTTQVEIERALEQSRQRMMLAFESTDDAVFDWRVGTGELFLAPKIAGVLGYRAGNLRDGYRDLCAPEDRVKLDAALAIGLTTPGNRFEVQHQMKTASGEAIWVLARGSIVEMTPEGTAARVAGTLRDISEHRRSEQERETLRLELIQAQKLEAIGRLASAVAHDFNNLLTVILASSEAIREMPDDTVFVQECGRDIYDACERASHLTSRLLAFSRKQVSQPRPLDLNDVLRDSEKMIRRLIGEDIAVSYSYGELGVRIVADPRSIDQVLLNLAVNARDAMPDGGSLRLSTRRVQLAENELDLSPGGYVSLTVSDSGHGMDESVRKRIFEPFFTTKEAGKGTGLGLSTVAWIVKELGGAVDVISSPGQGATFTMYFPTMAASDEVLAMSEAGPDVRGTETILLVEDQDDVRRVLAGRLRSFGYDVIPASGGGEALEIMRKLRKQVDVVVTDVIMADCRGPELADEIAKLQPGILTLYMSGYADRDIADRVADAAYIQKPFTADQLAAHVRALLSNRGEARRTIPL